ncbi:MAG TPA: heavy-metal-associated domain-containing protein [Syntrophobacter fumaroxidans]|nr:heavy-metal-associated domain-containing protein [Syntrophobacter fumaroxidans]
MTTLKIKGMSCGHCVKAVTKALSEIVGVTGVTVDLESGLATFESTGPVDMNLVRERIEKAGFNLV